MRRGYGSYEPLRERPPWWRRRPRWGWCSAWLRTAILGPLGWLALLGAILCVGLALAFVASRAGLPPLGGFAVGGLGALLAVVIADRARWARLPTGIGFAPPAGSGGVEVFADQVRRALADARMPAEVIVVIPPGPTPEIIAAGHPDRPGSGPSLHVSFRERDRRAVVHILCELGVPLPDRVARPRRYRPTRW